MSTGIYSIPSFALAHEVDQQALILLSQEVPKDKEEAAVLQHAIYFYLNQTPTSRMFVPVSVQTKVRDVWYLAKSHLIEKQGEIARGSNKGWRVLDRPKSLS